MLPERRALEGSCIAFFGGLSQTIFHLNCFLIPNAQGHLLEGGTLPNSEVLHIWSYDTVHKQCTSTCCQDWLFIYFSHS